MASQLGLLRPLRSFPRRLIACDDSPDTHTPVWRNTYTSTLVATLVVHEYTCRGRALMFCYVFQSLGNKHKFSHLFDYLNTIPFGGQGLYSTLECSLLPWASHRSRASPHRQKAAIQILGAMVQISIVRLNIAVRLVMLYNLQPETNLLKTLVFVLIYLLPICEIKIKSVPYVTE